MPFETCGSVLGFGDLFARTRIETVFDSLEKEVPGLRFEPMKSSTARGLLRGYESAARSAAQQNNDRAASVVANVLRQLSLAGATVIFRGKAIGAVSMVCAGKFFNSSSLLFFAARDPGDPSIGAVLDRIASALGGTVVQMKWKGRRQFIGVTLGTGAMENFGQSMLLDLDDPSVAQAVQDTMLQDLRDIIEEGPRDLTSGR